MLEKENSLFNPSMEDFSEYVNNSLWDKFCNYMIETYHTKPKFDFSKCSFEFGWNVKFKKGSQSLCTLYPRNDYFTIMIVIGNKEKAEFEKIYPTLHPIIRKIYDETIEGNGQRWLMIDVEDKDSIYKDVKRIIELRCHTK